MASRESESRNTLNHAEATEEARKPPVSSLRVLRILSVKSVLHEQVIDGGSETVRKVFLFALVVGVGGGVCTSADGDNFEY